jgi:hypothetical protein
MDIKRKYDFKSIEGLTTWLIRILKLSAFLYALSIVFSTLHFLVPYSLDDELELFDGLYSITEIPILFLSLLTIVLFGIWVVRANKNVRALGAKELSMSPGWALGHFFIPILNLWKPKTAMNQLWLASHNPSTWNGKPKEKSQVVDKWWGLLIASWAVSNSEMYYFNKAVTVEDYNKAMLIGIVASICSILSCKFAVVLVDKISTMQTEIFDRNKSLIGSKSYC